MNFNGGATQNAAYDTFILNVFDLQPYETTGHPTVELRGWTNSKAIENWAQNNDSYTDPTLLNYWTYQVTLGLRTVPDTSHTSDWVYITGYTPTSNNYQTWDWLGFIPRVGSWVQYIADKIFTLYNNSSVSQNETVSAGRIIMMEKKFIFVTLVMGQMYQT